MIPIQKNQEALNLLRGLLAEGKTVPVRYKGTSMHPFLQDGNWMQVVWAAPENVKLGSVVLFERGGELTVHRVCWKGRRQGCGWVRTGGDAERWLDPPQPLSELVGKVNEPRESGHRRLRMALRMLFRAFWQHVKIRCARGKKDA